MTKYIEEESGEFRHGEEGVFHGSECIFMAPPAQFVPQLMEQLFNWMKRNQVEVHPLVLSCIFHYEFVLSTHFLTGTAEWQDYGILLFFPNGNRSLNMFPLKAD